MASKAAGGTCGCLDFMYDESTLAYQAATGDPFLESAKDMIMLKSSYITTFEFADFFSRIFIHNGKFSIVAVNLVTLRYILKFNGNLTAESDNYVSEPYGLYLAMAAVTYMAATIFLEQVDNVIMTLLTCLSMDLAKNDPDD